MEMGVMFGGGCSDDRCLKVWTYWGMTSVSGVRLIVARELVVMRSRYRGCRICKYPCMNQ